MDGENSLTLLWPEWGSNPIPSDPQLELLTDCATSPGVFHFDKLSRAARYILLVYIEFIIESFSMHNEKKKKITEWNTRKCLCLPPLDF
jgi:hypothetical protein